MRDWVKALPVGVGLPLIIAGASVKPEDAASNIGAWVEWIGFHNVPHWLTNSNADQHVVAAAFFSAAIYSFAVWGPHRKKIKYSEAAVNSWGPWVLIVGGPLVGLVWLYLAGLPTRGPRLDAKPPAADLPVQPIPQEAHDPVPTKPAAAKRTKYTPLEAGKLIEALRRVRAIIDEELVPATNDGVFQFLLSPTFDISFQSREPTVQRIEVAITETRAKIAEAKQRIQGVIEEDKNYSSDLRTMVPPEDSGLDDIMHATGIYQGVLNTLGPTHIQRPNLILKPFNEKLRTAMAKHEQWISSTRASIEANMKILREDLPQ